MKKFTVIVTRDVTESAVLTVNAASLLGAQDEALRMVFTDTGQIGWELDDNAPGAAYVSDAWEEE